MAVALQASTGPMPDLCQRMVLRTKPKGDKTECVFTDGTSILVSNFLASFIRAGDEMCFPLALEAAGARTEIYIRNPKREARSRDIFQAPIGYATQPRKDKRDNVFVSAQVVGGRLAISTIHIRCEVLRDYFYVGNRHRAWDQQHSFYELLRVNANVSPAELHLAFKLRSLELPTARGSSSDLSTLERAVTSSGIQNCAPVTTHFWLTLEPPHCSRPWLSGEEPSTAKEPPGLERPFYPEANNWAQLGHKTLR